MNAGGRAGRQFSAAPVRRPLAAVALVPSLL